MRSRKEGYLSSDLVCPWDMERPDRAGGTFQAGPCSERPLIASEENVCFHEQTSQEAKMRHHKISPRSELRTPPLLKPCVWE